MASNTDKETVRKLLGTVSLAAMADITSRTSLDNAISMLKP